MFSLENKLLQNKCSFLQSQSLRWWALPLGNEVIFVPETTTVQKNAHRRQEECVCFIFHEQGHLSEGEGEYNTNQHFVSDANPC